MATVVNTIIPQFAQNVNIFCNIDNIPYTHKPADTEIGVIVNRLKVPERSGECSPLQLAKAIIKGYGFTHAKLAGAKGVDWVSQQLIIADIDNDKDMDMLSIEDCKDIMSARGIDFAFIYHTFSDSALKPKFRIVLVCKEVITEPETAKKMMAGFTSLFSQADTQCVDLSRMYYGTNNPHIEWGNGLVDNQLLLDLYQERVHQEPRPVREYTPHAPQSPGLDLAYEYARFDLMSYIEATTGTQGRRRGKDVLFNPCPLCGHNDDFYVDTDKNVFKCHSASGGYEGNILNYLEYSLGLDRQGARDYFKYDLLKVDREAERQEFLQSRNRTEIAQAVKAADVYDIEDDIVDCPWIKQEVSPKGKVTVKILCSILADHIRQNSHYIFVRDSARSETIRFFYTQGYYKQVSDDEMQGFIKALIPIPLQRMTDIKEVMGLLYTDLNTVPHEKLNPENIINFQNGILDLDTWILKPHSPDYLCTIQIPCDYVPNCPVPDAGRFDNFIQHLSSYNPDVEKLILQFMGVTISNVKGYRMKKALFMVGDGDTGKSQCKELLVKLIGENNNSGIDLSEIEARFGTSQVFNKRLVGANDMSYTTVSELKCFKKMTGGDSLFAEYKGGDGFNFRFGGVLWFCCNQLPKFGGDKGQWTYDRIVVVECNNPVPFKDKMLLEAMYKEREYIVSRAIDALKQVIDNGYEYDIPECSVAANNEYQIENNSFLRFLDECTEPRPNNTVSDKCTAKRMFDVYVAWCKDNNNGYYENKRAIKPMLEKIGKAHIKTVNGLDYYSSFTLTYATKATYSKVYDVWEETGNRVD